MNAVVVLEWNFSPSDYFEKRVDIEREDYTMAIDDGKAEAKIDSAVYDANPSMRDILHEELKLRFFSVQLISHKAYNLSRPSPTRLYPDGHRLVYLEGASVSRSSAAAESQITNKEKIVVVDTKRDRIRKESYLADLLIKHKDDNILRFMCQSYNDSVNNPDNEYSYLYDILEAIEKKFGGRKVVISVLKEFGLSDANLKCLGRLTNEPTRRQSRHRGKSGGTLINATESELSEVREAAKTVIEAYLEYLEKSSEKSLD